MKHLLQHSLCVPRASLSLAATKLLRATTPASPVLHTLRMRLMCTANGSETPLPKPSDAAFPKIRDESMHQDQPVPDVEMPDDPLKPDASPEIKDTTTVVPGVEFPYSYELPNPPTTPLQQPEMHVPPLGRGLQPDTPEQQGDEAPSRQQQEKMTLATAGAWIAAGFPLFPPLRFIFQTNQMHGVNFPEPHLKIPLHLQEPPPTAPAPDVVQPGGFTKPRHPPGSDNVPPPTPDVYPPHIRPDDVPTGPDMVPPGGLPGRDNNPPAPKDTPPGGVPSDLPGDNIPESPDYPAGDVIFPGGTEGAPAPAMMCA